MTCRSSISPSGPISGRLGSTSSGRSSTWRSRCSRSPRTPAARGIAGSRRSASGSSGRPSIGCGSNTAIVSGGSIASTRRSGSTCLPPRLTWFRGTPIAGPPGPTCSSPGSTSSAPPSSCLTILKKRRSPRCPRCSTRLPGRIADTGSSTGWSTGARSILVMKRGSSEELRSTRPDAARTHAAGRRVGSCGVCAIGGADRAPVPGATAGGVSDSPTTAGRDHHAANSPGHPLRWSDARRTAVERAARDRAGRPRGRRRRSARRAPAALIGGTIVHIERPRRFAKPSRVTLELGQLVQTVPGRSELVPWVFDLEDRRFNVQMRRRLTLALFAAEGAGIGASLARRPGHRAPRTWGSERGWACSPALVTPA